MLTLCDFKCYKKTRTKSKKIDYQICGTGVSRKKYLQELTEVLGEEIKKGEK